MILCRKLLPVLATSLAFWVNIILKDPSTSSSDVVVVSALSTIAVPTTLSGSRRFLFTKQGTTITPTKKSHNNNKPSSLDVRHATLHAAPQNTINVSNDQKEGILDAMASLRDEATEYADMFGLTHSEAAVYAVFAAIRNTKTPLGLKGEPFVLRRDEIINALGLSNDNPPFDHFFTMKDFSKAVEDDFLDAARGSTDNRKGGWKITNVSAPRGESFEEARMTFQEVEEALEKGTVILNAIGAHVPKLAGPSLACTDAASMPNAMNLYVTAAGKRTSAPPHTDKQDVVVIQTSGQKHWRVFAPPDSSRKPMADMFARGKLDDGLPLHALMENNDSPRSSQLLIETVLKMGDILFVPAAFPHTTSTAHHTSSDLPDDATSVHLTFNIDSHVWQLDYLSARQLALRRACVVDTALGQTNDSDNRYEGKANELPPDVRQQLFDALPMGLLDDDDKAEAMQEMVASELKRISFLVDEKTASAVGPETWDDAVARLRQQGMELLETHRDMYLAAIKEGRTREAEDAMTAHLDESVRKFMSPERIMRLSLFRVKEYYDHIDASISALREWSYSGKPKSAEGEATTGSAEKATPLPENWAFTLPVKVGDEILADLGGAFFDATVTRIVGDKYDVRFFDGDMETGLDRSMLKLKAPPAMGNNEVDTSYMTPKQLKRWQKEQKKKQSFQK